MGNKYIEELRKFIEDFFKNDNVKIILFGSRARGDNYLSSDVDIGLLPADDFDARKLVILREKFENLNIPYKVEIINLRGVSEDFKNLIMKEGIIWKD